LTRKIRILCAFLLATGWLFVVPTESRASEGLTAELYNVLGQNNAPYIPQGETATVKTTVPNIDFQWGGGSILGGPSEDVIVRFTGSIRSNTTQDISFLAQADDGTKLYVDGALITSDWVDKGGGGTTSPPVSFTAGVPKTIELMYYENGGGAWVKLLWNQSGSMQVIPAEAFTSQAPTVKTIGAPRNLTVVDGVTSTVLDWDAPDTGNTQPERYAISFNCSGCNGWGIATGNVGGPNSLNTTIIIDHSLLESLMPSGTVWSFHIRSDNDTLHLYSENSNIVTIKIGKTTEELDAERAAVKAEEERLAAIAAAEKARVEAEAAAKLAAELAAKAEAERLAAIEAARIQAEKDRLAAEAAALAEQQRLAAEAAAKKAEEERIAAELAAAKAEADRLAAEEAARKAEEEKIAAELAKAKAEEEARLAEEARLKAEAEAKAAEEARLKAEEEARLAEEAKLKAEEEAKAKAEKEAQAKADKLKAEEDAKAKAEAERIAKEKAEEERLAKIAEEAKAGKELSKEEVSVVVASLVENLKPGESVSSADIKASGISYSDLPASTPVEIRADENGNPLIITAEVAANIELVTDAGALLETAFTDPGAALAAIGSIGADMTQEERKESTEAVVATVVAAGAAINAVGAATGSTGGSTSGGSSGGGSGGGGASGESKGVRRRQE
jgi:hypothetical protein